MSLFKRKNLSTFFTMKKVIILAFLVLSGQSSWAQIREYQTSRLISTSGAGVASILTTESAILNPASSAFFQGSSFSYQSYNSKLQKESDQCVTDNNPFPGSNRSEGFFMSDNSGPVRGGLAYISQKENGLKRSRFNFHGAAPIGKQTAMGARYSFIEDKNQKYKSRHQSALGLTHIVDEKMIFGLVLIDPTRATPNEERVIAGVQFAIADRLTLIGDVGAQFTKALTKKYLWRAAVQITLFNDFFIRGGQYYDNIYEMKGTSWGAGWVGPRFGIEFAQKYSQQFGSGFYLYEDEKIVDTSLSAIIKF